jgi:magnesium transporter
MIVDCALYRDGIRQDGPLPLEAALESAEGAPDGFVWIEVDEPTAAEFNALAAEFELHPLAVEDALHAHQRPKLEVYGDVAFMVLKTVRYIDPDEVIDVGEVMVFVASNFAITVHYGQASVLGEARRRLEANPELLRTDPASVLYAVADLVVDEYGGPPRVYAATSMRSSWQSSPASGLNPPSGCASSNARCWNSRGPYSRWPPRWTPSSVARWAWSIPTSRRTSVTCTTMCSVPPTRSPDLTSCSPARCANLTQIQVRQNDDMRAISAWAAIFAVNTVIVGIYGMNFLHMPELRWKFGYPWCSPSCSRSRPCSTAASSAAIGSNPVQSEVRESCWRSCASAIRGCGV